MNNNLEFVRKRGIVAEAFDSEIVQHNVERDEFLTLLLSRRPLARCDDELSHRHGLLDPESGDLFEIDESDLLS